MLLQYPMLNFIIIIAFILIVLIYLYRSLRGESLSKYTVNSFTKYETKNSDGLIRLYDYLQSTFNIEKQPVLSRSGWSNKREAFDAAALAREFDCEFRKDEFAVGDHVLDGAWTLVEGFSSENRILYLHGGAYTVGSDVSHRPITYQIAKRTKCAVFALNYRLMPESDRKDSIFDCQAGYDWILNNGPDGPESVRNIAISGDSAGGNLALMLSHWSRKLEIKSPNAVVVLSPQTDCTFQSPSMHRNQTTDPMLKPLLSGLLKMPRFILLWLLYWQLGHKPSDPLISPIFNELSNLPPTLIQVSSSEMLFDDSIRYVEKARKHGSEVKLQIWDNLPHVWQIFDNFIDESHKALDQIGRFLDTNGFNDKIH